MPYALEGESVSFIGPFDAKEYTDSFEIQSPFSKSNPRILSIFLTGLRQDGTSACKAFISHYLPCAAFGIFWPNSPHYQLHFHGNAELKEAKIIFVKLFVWGYIGSQIFLEGEIVKWHTIVCGCSKSAGAPCFPWDGGTWDGTPRRSPQHLMGTDMAPGVAAALMSQHQLRGKHSMEKCPATYSSVCLGPCRLSPKLS